MLQRPSSRASTCGRLFSVPLPRITSVPECAVSSVDYCGDQPPCRRLVGVLWGSQKPRGSPWPTRHRYQVPQLAEADGPFPSNLASPLRSACRGNSVLNDAPMFVKASFFHFRNRRGPVICWSAGCGHDRDGPLRVEGEVGLRARFRCCRRPFPASPLPHPACPSQGTGRSTCLSCRVSRRWRRLLVSGSRGSGCCCRDSGSASR